MYLYGLRWSAYAGAHSMSGVASFLVVVVSILVLIEREAAVTTGEDIEIDGLCRFLVAPFHFRTQW